MRNHSKIAGKSVRCSEFQTAMLRGFAAAAVMCALAACGGGGEPPTASQHVETRDFTPSLTPDAAAIAIASTVTKVESPIATGAVGQRVPVVDNDGQSENVLFASNDAGDVVFIGADSGDTPMGVETTAKYLALLGLLTSDNPAELPPNNVRPFLESASSFPALVAAVKSELEKGIAVSHSEVIGDYVSDVVLEAQRAYAESLSSAASSPATKAAASYNIPGLDYYLIDQANDEKLWISNRDGQSVTIQNRTFLQWAVQSTNLATGASLGGPTVIPTLKTTTSQLIGSYAGSESKTDIPTAARTGLKIGQNRESINANAVLLVFRSTFAIIDIATYTLKAKPTISQKCVTNVAKTLTTKSTFAAFLAAPSVNGFNTFLRSIDSLDVIQRTIDCAEVSNVVTNTAWYQAMNASTAACAPKCLIVTSSPASPKSTA